MQPQYLRNLHAATLLFMLGFVPAPATEIGTGQTVTDTSLAGQNIDFDSTLTYVSTGTDSPYDTGAGLVDLSPMGYPENDFTGSLGTGAGQVQWTGSGGFTSSNFTSKVNIGGLSTPETLTWGQGGFVPSESALVLGNNVNFENSINLGTDPSATRQIDIGNASLSGLITGSGNLLIQAYGQIPYGQIGLVQLSGHDLVLHIDAALDPTINIQGQLTLDNVLITLGGIVSAGSYNLMNDATLNTITQGTSDVTLSGGSIWAIPTGILPGDTSKNMGALNSTDPTSIVILGEDNDCSLTVHSGYYAGQLRDDSTFVGVGGSIIKDGSGIFTLANDNSGRENGGYAYSQGTTVKEGTLLVTNASGSATGTGAVTVMSGASLGGTGIIAPTGTSAIVVQSGGKVDLTAFDPAHEPDSLINTLTMHLSASNSATFETGATFAFDLGSGATSDELAFTGLTKDDPQVIFNDNVVDLNLLPGAGPGTYTLFSFDQDDAYVGTLQNGADYTFNYGADDISVTLAAPEPATGWYALGGLLFLALSRIGRRRAGCQLENGTKIA
jgi:hypothetical protein